MVAYKFQLRFRLPETSYIDADITSTELTVANGSQKILIVSRPSNSFRDSVTFDAIGDGFSSKEAATIFGQKIKNTIIISCAFLGMGVQIGKHEEVLDLSSVKKGNKNQQYVQPENLDGLVVCPNEAEIVCVSINFSMKNGTSLDKFQNTFSKSYDLSKNFNKKLSLAFELYTSHFFESSIHARFLQLISIVECLAKQERQKKNIINHLERLICLSKNELSEAKDISDKEMDYFIERLHNLKRESIAVACRNLIQKYLGNEEAATFKNCYNVRSQLVHDGSIKEGLDIVEYHNKIHSLSRNLLYSIITKSGDGSFCN